MFPMVSLKVSIGTESLLPSTVTCLEGFFFPDLLSHTSLIVLSGITPQNYLHSSPPCGGNIITYHS